MTSLLQFASKSGRARSLLALYVIHSLDKKEKSGYDILREIEKLTSGAWVPSKGTLYPLLHQLETEGLIAPAPGKEGARARMGFVLTRTGRDTLKRIKAHSREHHKKMDHYRHLITAIFGDCHSPGMSVLFEIKTLVDEMPKEKEHEAVRILRRCRDDLKKVT
ncbi:MAG: PadR family transcriptional regulator [Methanoregula sp.]|nr:PadR family transcriptional regulator [Methanoregula sp.]